MKATALALRFLLELAALTSLFIAGFTATPSWLGWSLGIALVLAAATAWGLFVAPRARIAAPTAIRLAVEMLVFAGACIALLVTDRPAIAGVLGGLYVLHRLMLWLAGAPVFEPSPAGEGARNSRRYRR